MKFKLQSLEKTKSLYDTDYHLWVLETVQKLQDKNFNDIDWESLMEEVIDLSHRQKRKLESLLVRLFEHLLKLKYWKSEIERNRGHWEAEIINFRKQIKKELRNSPSLKNYLLEILPESYQDGREIAARRSQLPLNIFPEVVTSSIDQILDEDWFL